ncbi:MAG: glycosyltransferase family 2 protein [Verrucomicrobia bacterium]|nr:glycosyltransferase family 2 protein [Verrucomicrobiota bacterium]
MEKRPAHERISACITAGNEEANIRRCLESIKWADEIVVVDSFSTDRTVEISKAYTDRVYQHKWRGYIGQKNLIKDMATGPWILFVDADEEVSEELRLEIQSEFASGACQDYAGYEFPRIVKYLGRWIRHGDWYPDIKLRLFRKDKGTCGGREPHDRTFVNGPVKRLRHHMHHFTYRNIQDQLATVNNFSSITARTKYAEGKRFGWLDLMFRPLVRFVRGYFLRRGFLDGLPGLIISVTTAYGVFIKYAKLWEIDREKEATPTTESLG